MSWSYLLEGDNLTSEQLRKYNVSELQAALEQLNLESTGKKHELVERLFQFWLEIQSPTSGASPKSGPRVSPTTVVKFKLTEIPDYLDLRAELEVYGCLTAFLVDPENSCYFAAYKAAESARKLFEDADQRKLVDPEYVLEGDFEKRAREMKLMTENAQISNAIQRAFKRTHTEPRLFWRPKIQNDE